MNPEHLDAFFDGREGLDRLSLFEVALDREGPTLRIRADLFRFPDYRAKRWPAQVNRAQVTLSLFGVKALDIHGWASTVEGVLAVQRGQESPELNFRFSGSGVTIGGRCAIVRLDGVTAYEDGAG